jgi:hypothetical protein
MNSFTKKIMKNLLIIFLFCIQAISCKTLFGNPDAVTPAAVNIPEAGEYSSFIVQSTTQLQYTYSVVTQTWEWKFGPGIQLLPNPLGRLKFDAKGNYEFTDQKKTGTYKLDKTSNVLKFTGYMADAEGYYNITRGTCLLIISIKQKDGTYLSTQYEKKSDFIQPDVKNPSGSFTGTIVNSLIRSSTDFIDISNSKVIKSFNSNGLPVTGKTKITAYCYKNNPADYDEKYPNLEVLDAEGNKIYKYKGLSAKGNRWAIGEYWYASPSPDGTKVLLTGQYHLHSSVFDPNYVTPYPMVSVIDIKTGEELKTFDIDAQNNWGASWAPNGDLVMPKKGGGINIVSANLNSTKTIYTKQVTEARVSINNTVLYGAGTGIYTMNMDGSNIQQLKNSKLDITTQNYTDMCWSPDGKSIAIMYKNTSLNYFYILFSSADGTKVANLNDSKGDILRLSSGLLNWL